MLLMLYSVVVARVAAAACPDLARMRTARVVEGFDGAKLEGPALWYEHAFIDIAQIGATCQTLGVRYSKSTHDVSMDFRVTYGKLPFTIVEDYAANRSIPGLFTKEAEMPGAGLLKLPTVVVDVGTAPGAGGQYSSMILYSCAMKLGLPIIELVIATRQPTISPPELQALLEVAKQQKIRWKPGELKLVNRSGCKSQSGQGAGESVAASTAALDTIVRPPAGKVGEPVGLVLLQGAEIPTVRYKPLAEALVAAVSFPLSVAIPEFIGGMAEPVQVPSCVHRALKEMALPAGSALFAAGHSLGAVMAQDYAFSHASEFKGLVLMGGALQRKCKSGNDLIRLARGSEWIHSPRWTDCRQPFAVTRCLLQTGTAQKAGATHFRTSCSTVCWTGCIGRPGRRSPTTSRCRRSQRRLSELRLPVRQRWSCTKA
jgi:hypothetical protein